MKVKTKHILKIILIILGCLIVISSGIFVVYKYFENQKIQETINNIYNIYNNDNRQDIINEYYTTNNEEIIDMTNETLSDKDNLANVYKRENY